MGPFVMGPFVTGTFSDGTICDGPFCDGTFFDGSFSDGSLCRCTQGPMEVVGPEIATSEPLLLSSFQLCWKHIINTVAAVVQNKEA
jgi:hypothetical protein